MQSGPSATHQRLEDGPGDEQEQLGGQRQHLSPRLTGRRTEASVRAGRAMRTHGGRIQVEIRLAETAVSASGCASARVLPNIALKTCRARVIVVVVHARRAFRALE